MSIVPIYYQIKQSIKNWIANKEYIRGERIPSENELAKKFHVSRLTVRQAISELVREGLLTRRRGEGTFVTRDDRILNSFSLEFSGFMDDLFYQVQKSKTKSARIDRIAPPTFIREKLELDEKDEEIVQIKRVRFLEDRSFAYTVNYLPFEIGKAITEKELYEKPLLQIMEEDLGIQFAEAFQTIQASFADQELAEKLSVPAGLPILFVERVMFDEKHRPVEMVQSSYRGDLYKYIVRLKRLKRNRESTWIHSGDI